VPSYIFIEPSILGGISSSRPNCTKITPGSQGILHFVVILSDDLNILGRSELKEYFDKDTAEYLTALLPIM
jgi:hypothetical protein